MVELSQERIDEILKKETVKKEDADTILRSVYIRYMRLFERYFVDINALNDEVIDELRNYHEETKSLVKYFFMDIPQDACDGIREFEKKYIADILGPYWQEHLMEAYRKFRMTKSFRDKSEEHYREEFSKEVLDNFYSAMDYVFREGFGTGSKMAENVGKGLMGLLCGKESKS